MLIRQKAIDEYLKYTAGFFFVILYIGFAVYNVLVAYGLMPPVFGGFFGLFTVIYLFSCVPFFFRLKAKYIRAYNSSIMYISLFCFYFLYIIFLAVLNYLLYPSDDVLLAFTQTLESSALLLGAFLIGMNIKLSNRLYSISLFAIILSFFLLFYYVLKTGNVMFYARSFALDSAIDAVSTYQGFSRSAMVLCLLVVSMIKSQRNYMLFYMVSVFILFVLGSRSELVGFAFGAGLLLFIKYKLRVSSALKLLILLLLLMVLFGFLYDNFSSNRNFQLLNLSSSSSWISRDYLQDLALKHILENPMFGYFAGHVIDGGSTGAYVHNILSVWAGFGFVPFVTYGLLCFIPFIDCMRLILNRKNINDKIYFCFSLSTATVLLVLFSKPMYWFVPGIVWGLYISIKKEVNYELQ